VASTVNNSEGTQFQAGAEQVETATKGGIASGKVRREKKAMKDTLATLLSMPLKDGMADDIDQIKSIASLNGKNITVQEAIMLAQIKKAVKGDTKAAEFVRDSSGNKLKEGIEITGEINNPFAELSTEDLKKLIVDD
jgi:hypothetical protein